MPVHDHLWWLVSRSSGAVALLAMSISVVCGLVLANRLAGKQVKRVIAAHEHLALVALFATAVHGLALLGDGFMQPGLLGIAVPFVVDYRPPAVAAGIVGGYLAAVLGLSFYVRRRLGGKRWRQLHRFTVVAWLLSVGHTAFAGSDVGSLWLRAPLLASVGIVAALFTARLLGTRSGSRRSSTPTRTATARSPAT